MYYLQSRYYDPEVCRFINADEFVSTGQGTLGYNMFAYCGNEPVARTDSSGNFFFTALGAAIGAGVSALGAWARGGTSEDIAKAAKAGAISGAIAGAGVDIAVSAMYTFGASAVVGVAIVGVLGAAGGVIGTGIESDWTADGLDYVISGVVGGLTNIISFGLAPINGEIAKGTVMTVVKGIAKEGIKNLGSNIAGGMIVTNGAYWTTAALCQ